MVRRAWKRSILLAGFLAALFSLLDAPRVLAGWGQELTDEEMDAIYAQGLSIIDISFGNDLFNFSSTTKIRIPDIPIPNVGAKIDFLGGLVSINADPPALPTPASNPGSSNPGPSAGLAVFNPMGGSTPATNPGGSNPGPSTGPPASNPVGGSNPATQSSPSTPRVTVVFGDTTANLKGHILSITAMGVTVKSDLNIQIDLNSIGNPNPARGVIRRAMGAL